MKKTSERSAVLALGTIFTFAVSTAMTVILIPLISDALDFSATIFGVLIAIPGAVTIVFEIPLAAWSDRVGRKPMLAIGILLGFLGTLLLAYRIQIGYFVFFVITNALAVVLFFPSILALLSEASREEDQARLQGINGFVQGIAFSAGAWIAGQLVDWFSFRSALYAIAVAYILSFIQTLFTPETLQPSRENHFSIGEVWRAYQAVIRLLLERSPIQLAALIETLYSILIVVLGNAFFPLYITSKALGSAAFAGGLLSVRNLSSTGASLFYGQTSRRFGTLRPLFGMLAVTSLTFIFLPKTGFEMMWYGVLIVQGLGVGFIPAAPNVLIAEGTAPSERALGYASVTFISRTMQLIFPPIFGLVADRVGLRAVFPLGGALTLGLIIIAALKSRALEVREPSRF